MEIALSNILFLDLETVSMTESFETLPERLKPHWEKKSFRLDKETSIEKTYFDRAAIYAEFGKILCIGLGNFNETTQQFRVTTLYAENEKELLQNFVNVLEKYSKKDILYLCAHNGKEFDFPYLCRRMLVNEISLPEILNISGKKPWETKLLDTLEMWKFGDYKSYTSLDLLASLFGIESSKNTMDGSEVNAAYYLENNLNGILQYCKEDVVVLAQLYCRLTNKPLIHENLIKRV